MKRIWLVFIIMSEMIAALFISSPLFAYSDDQKGRFYGGIQIGEDNYQTTYNLQLIDDDVDIVNMNPSISAQGLVGGFVLGYGHYFPHQLYLAAETFYNWSHARSNMVYNSQSDSGLDLDQLNSQFQANHSYGIVLLPGIKLNSLFLIYARLGFEWTSFTSVQSFAIDYNIPSNLINTYFNKSALSRGFNYGLGVEAFVTKSLSLRGEYNHINYTHFSTSTSTYNSEVILRPRNHQLMISAIYSFATF